MNQHYEERDNTQGFQANPFAAVPKSFRPSFLLSNTINPLERLDSRLETSLKRSHVILNLETCTRRSTMPSSRHVYRIRPQPELASRHPAAGELPRRRQGP